MRILYIEDNPLDADLVRRTLARSQPDWSVEIADTLAQGRQRLGAGDAHDLLLCDLNLPDGHGNDLILELRARALPLAVVALTSQGDESVVLSALKAGADDYLPKKDDLPQRLPGTLRAALQRFRSDAARHARALRVLYAEHDPTDLDLTRRHFERHAVNIQLRCAHDADATLAALPASAAETSAFDVLLLDYRLTGDTGLDVLKVLRDDRGLDLPVVMVTGQGNEEVAAQAMRLGATDYLIKRNSYLAALPAVLENAFHRVEAAREHAALRHSQERLALVLRGSNDAPWDIDLDGGERYLSPRLWQMLGWDEGPQGADPLPHAGEAGALLRRIEAAVRGPEDSFEVELTLCHRDGRAVPLLARGCITRDASGRAVRASGTCTDLTERRRAEAAIRELNATLERRVAERTRELEQANRELEAFSLSVSHDLRAPLRAVDGLSALLEQDHAEALGPEGRHKLHLLRGSTARMERLIRDLLEFARAARQKPTRTTVPTTLLVQHGLDEFRDEIAQRSIDVQIGKLPDCHADPNLLRQVFVNLIGNAVKYTRKQPRPRIEIAATQRDGQCVYSVRDNGAGFDMKYAGKLFTVFQRLHPESEFEGSGVGLAIVDRIVQRHGGKVWVEAAPQHGAAFFFTLGEAEAEPEPAAPDPR